MRTVGGEPATSVEEDEVVTNCSLDGGRGWRHGRGATQEGWGWWRGATHGGMAVDGLDAGRGRHRSWARLGAPGFIGQGER